jgi:signal transduction histidine kinase/ligand-binding sensor domain-containing protein
MFQRYRFLRGGLAAKRGMALGVLRFAMVRVFWIFCAVSPVWAVDPSRHISQYAHNTWTITDGYINGNVLATGQTADGYFWIGTEAGLVRFDGVRFVPWDPPGERAAALSSREITALLGARDGSLWIAARSTRAKASLSHWTGSELVNYTVDSDFIGALLERRDGSVWMARPLCQLIGTETRCYGGADGVPSFRGALALTEDATGNLWLGGDTGLVRWRPDSSTAYMPEGLKANGGQGGVSAFAAAPDGSVWVGVGLRGRGMGLEHVVQGRWNSLVAPGFEGSSLEVLALLLDRSGALWIGTVDQGIYRVYQNKVDHFGSADGLSSDWVLGLYEDREGNVWATTPRGIDRFRDTRVATYSTREGLCTSEVDSVLAAQDGTLWIGGAEGLIALRQDRMTCVAKGRGLPGSQVTSLFEDHQHQLWVGIDDMMTIYEKGRFTPITRRNGTPLGLSVGITEDVDHSIWIVSGGHHRALFRIKDRKVQEEFEEPQIPVPHKVAADPQGGIWLGLMNGDLARYRDGRTETFHFDLKEGSIVNQLSVGVDGSVMGATDSGIVALKNGRPQTLTARNGLPCDAVSAFILDDSGALWLYMRCGLVEIARKELQKWWQRPELSLNVRVFNALDGMQPGTAPFQGSARTSNGQLWFANDSVLQMIDPGRLTINSLAPLVHVEEVIADRKRYLPGPSLRLPPYTRNLEIDYTAPSFAIPQRVRFRYWLEGHDGGWQDAGTRRQAFYSDLRPGQYRFRVVACNEDGVWNETGATLDLRVAPAWYQTMWFLAGCVVVLLFSIWTAYRLRVGQVARALSARFDERLAERTRIARDLHDTLLQTIQGSKLVVDDALEQPGDPMRLRRAVEQLSIWLQRAIEEGRTALDSLRASRTDSNDLAQALRRATEERGIQGRLEVSFSMVGTARELHPVVRDEVYQICEEAIRNVCAHSDGSRMEVELRYAQDLAVRVSDNGVGMDPSVAEHGKKGHFGLQGMRERAGHIGGRLTVLTSAGSGTEITLVVPGSVAFRGARKSVLDSIKAILQG